MLSPLERHLDSTGVSIDNPGRRLARAAREAGARALLTPKTRSRSRSREADIAFVPLTAFMTSTSNDDLEKHLEEFTRYQACWAERISTPQAVAFQAAVKSKAKQRASLEKRGKLFDLQQVGFRAPAIASGLATQGVNEIDLLL